MQGCVQLTSLDPLGKSPGASVSPTGPGPEQMLKGGLDKSPLGLLYLRIQSLFPSEEQARSQDAS